MSERVDDPRCPECGEPIGQRATYCMHCSADLSDRRDTGDVDGDGIWEGAESSSATEETSGRGTPPSPSGDSGRRLADALGVSTDAVGTDEQLLRPDGLVDDTLTVVVGIVGGIVVGLIGTVVLTAVTGGAVGVLFGFVAWLGATAYLVRRRTVQGAIAKSGYAVALVLLLVPVVALSPFVTVEGGISGRGGLFVTLLVFVAVPAVVAAVVGWVASRFVPADARTEN